MGNAIKNALKLGISLEGKSGCLFDPEGVYPGVSLGGTVMKRMGSHFVAETGLEGGFYVAPKSTDVSRGPVGAFMGVGIFTPFSESALIVTARGKSGYDFSNENPYAGVGMHAAIAWETHDSEGNTPTIPFIALDGGYTWNHQHGGEAIISAGFFFDLGA